MAILLSFANNKINAQHKNDFEAGLLNVGFAGFVSGIGAVINKKPNEKIGKVFLKGFGQGALGGYLIFESKRLVGEFGKTGDYGYIWPSKLINSAGTSIIENAAANRDFWDSWHLNIGFSRVEFYTKDKFKVSYRIMPFALGNTLYGFTQGNWDFTETIKTGSFIFKSNNIKVENGLISNLGTSYANTVVILDESTVFGQLRYKTISHELIHVYQYESFSGLNSYLNKPIIKLNKNKWFKTYNKIFYTDFNYLTFRGLYNLNTNHNSNFFENEARYYTEK